LESGEDRSHERGRTTDCIASSTNTSTWTFTQEDPIGLAGGLNLYGFAGGDPVNFSDPFGLFRDCRKVRCPTVERILASRGFRQIAREAFAASQQDGLERGGFLYLNADGSIRAGEIVVGKQGEVELPPAPDDAIAEFHTHPDKLEPDGPPTGNDDNRVRSSYVHSFILRPASIQFIRWWRPGRFGTVRVTWPTEAGDDGHEPADQEE
jgi:hypothetical protein